MSAAGFVHPITLNLYSDAAHAARTIPISAPSRRTS